MLLLQLDRYTKCHAPEVWRLIITFQGQRCDRFNEPIVWHGADFVVVQNQISQIGWKDCIETHHIVLTKIQASQLGHAWKLWNTQEEIEANHSNNNSNW